MDLEIEHCLEGKKNINNYLECSKCEVGYEILLG